MDAPVVFVIFGLLVYGVLIDGNSELGKASLKRYLRLPGTVKVHSHLGHPTPSASVVSKGRTFRSRAQTYPDSELSGRLVISSTLTCTCLT